MDTPPASPQVKWKDLITDLNLTPSNLNPERVDEDASLPFPLRIAKAVMPTDEVGGWVARCFLACRRACTTLLTPLHVHLRGCIPPHPRRCHPPHPS